MTHLWVSYTSLNAFCGWLKLSEEHYIRDALNNPRVINKPAASSRQHYFRSCQPLRLSQLTCATDIHCRSLQRYKRYLSLTAKSSRQSPAVGIQKVAVAMLVLKGWQWWRGLRGLTLCSENSVHLHSRFLLIDGLWCWVLLFGLLSWQKVAKVAKGADVALTWQDPDVQCWWQNSRALWQNPPTGLKDMLRLRTKSRKYGESATLNGIPFMQNSRNIFLSSTACCCFGTFGCMYCPASPSCCLI